MDIIIFGNPDLETDSLPIQLVPQLRDAFPQSTFTVRDPLDEWPPAGEPRPGGGPETEKIFIIDTVAGADKVRAFTTLEGFDPAPTVSLHDYDLHAELALRKKLGTLPAFVIFGVPSGADPTVAFSELVSLLRQHGA